MNKPEDDLASTQRDISRLSHQLQASRSKDEALSIAIKAAEVSMQALKLSSDAKQQGELSSRVKDFLEKAEQIKSRTDWRNVVQPSSTTSGAGQSEDSLRLTTGAARKLKEPISTRKLTTKEKILLLKASYLHGFKFPPWESPPPIEEFELKDGEEPFLDVQTLPLSELQEDVLEDWRRAPHALPPPSWYPDDQTRPPPSMDAVSKMDLVQDAATDCSVVASLCAAVSRLDRGFAKMTNASLCPYDVTNDRPLLSKNGKYISRLNFNGCFRKVVIDDRLPTSSTSRVIYVVDRSNPGLLWPALIEKAYLKVRGGYDFPGSNSGTDLWILTGWIPEQVFLQSDELEPERFWQRILNGFKYGDVLITMGTGKMSSETERRLGLASEHDYAVLELREVDGQRLMLVKNPWCEGMSWCGKTDLSHEDDTKHVKSDSEAADSGDQLPVRSPRDLLNAHDQLSPGTFWMDLANVMQHFESIYLNWNPGLFKFRQDLHFSWNLATTESDLTIPRGRFASLSRHPQFTVVSATGGTIWVLLSRHFQNAVPADATAEEIEADRYGIELNGHMSLFAFLAGGHRVLLPDKAVEKGWLVDSPQTLLKLDGCAPGQPYTLVPAEQELPAINHTFTISAFSNSSITLEEAVLQYPYISKLSAAWTKDTAGGNAHSPTYSRNPQFSIKVSRRTRINLLLESMNDELNIHVKLVYGKGQRVHTVRNRDIVFDSKDYRRGCCVAESDALEPGAYTIVCSTFEPQQFAAFTLLVESNEPTQLALLPREGAGRMRVELKTATFLPGQNRVAIPLVAKRLTRFNAIASYLDLPRSEKAPSRPSRPLLRMSIEAGRMPITRILTSSGNGEYTDCSGGIRTNDIDIGPESEIWLVLDRMAAASDGYEERYGVELFVDQSQAVESGDWRAVEDW